MRGDAVGNQFGRLEGSSFFTNITGVDNAIPLDCDLRADFSLLVEFELDTTLV